MLEYQIKEELVDGLCRIFSNSISQIILYGSVARKEAAPESDVDIAIVLDGKWRMVSGNNFLPLPPAWI